MNVLPSVIGFLLGLSVSGIILGAVNIRFIRELLETLHEDNLRAAEQLKHSDENVTRKVEEQNMTAISARLDEIERDSEK